jgi:hypothetical protein
VECALVTVILPSLSFVDPVHDVSPVPEVIGGFPPSFIDRDAMR